MTKKTRFKFSAKLKSKDALEEYFDALTLESIKKKVEKTLKIEIDEDAFDRLYGHTSHLIEIRRRGQKIAVRVVTQHGKEVKKMISTNQ